MKQSTTIIIFTEANVGMLVRVCSMFLRRRIQIESLLVAPSGVEGIHRFTIVITETEEETRKLLLQIDKQVDVFKTFYYSNSDVVWQEQVLFKVSNTINKLEALVKT